MGGKAFFPEAFGNVNLSIHRKSQKAIVRPFTERS
jgi:hypothetical protein